jgi:hypothetical protein
VNDSEIRRRTQERLASGELQRTYHTIAKPLTPVKTPPTAITAGSALNDPCAVCDDRGTQIRYNLPAGTVAFHERCYAIWTEEAAKPIRRE